MSTNASIDGVKERPRFPRMAPSPQMEMQGLLRLVRRRPKLRAPPPTPRAYPRDAPRCLEGHPQSVRSLPSNPMTRKQEHELVKMVHGLEIMEQPQVPLSRIRASNEYPMMVHHCCRTMRCK
ncbi:hypothetical protein Tco_1130061 [Tanacetum coccineum]